MIRISTQHANSANKSTAMFNGPMTFMLPDNTKVTVGTQPAANNKSVSYADQVTITRGNQAYQVTGLSEQNKAGLSVQKSRDGRALDAAAPDGYTVRPPATAAAGSIRRPARSRRRTTSESQHVSSPHATGDNGASRWHSHGCRTRDRRTCGIRPPARGSRPVRVRSTCTRTDPPRAARGICLSARRLRGRPPRAHRTDRRDVSSHRMVWRKDTRECRDKSDRCTDSMRSNGCTLLLRRRIRQSRFRQLN